MNLTNWLLLICTALTLASLTWWGCAWWYGRRVSDLRQRIDKLRNAATLHANQARHQITLLQKELAERPALTPVQRSARDEAQARRAALDSQLDERAAESRLPAHGFADTQPLL
ncbi:MAG: hypothetical protein V4750_18975 [Pseudomonadota bacterium]